MYSHKFDDTSERIPGKFDDTSERIPGERPTPAPTPMPYPAPVPPAHNGMYPSYMQPSGRDRRLRSSYFPFFTLFTAVANVVVFVLVMYINNCPANIPSSQTCILGSTFKRMSFQPFSENPLLGPSSATLTKMGGLMTTLVVQQKEGWRLMSCVWLHAGVFHIVVNLIALLVFGIQLEKDFGFFRIGLVYLVSGLGGSLLSSLFHSNTISVGASGALFGLLGATVSELITNWSHYRSRCSQLTQLIVLTAVNLAVGLLPHVDNFAHIGGFLTGFFLGFVILMKPQFAWVSRKDLLDPSIQRPVKSRYHGYQWFLLAISTVVVIAGFAAGFYALYSNVDVNSKCSWCHYLNCLPTSAWKCDSTS